jgi:DNA primase
VSFIAKNTIQEVIGRLDAIALVEEYVRLEKKGARWWGRCPFHAGGQEKTASFTVDPDKKMFYCFGCGKGGDVIGFIREMDKLSYPDAIKTLARKLGIPVVYEDSGAVQEESPDDKRKDALFELYSRTSVSFHHFLIKNPEKNEAYRYVVSRGISAEMIERFNLGYAPAGRDWLYRFLSGKGYSQEFLGSSGLFSANYKEMAFFSDRLIFPIVDRQGRTLAFGGRAMPSDERRADGREPPKYLNSRDSDIFKKGQNLFGINLALEEIRRSKTVYIAEGYMDVIALHQAGIQNAVAPLGTAFTDEQAKLLRRWAERVVLVFDSDKAGQDAAYKGILICRKNGLSCFLTVPGQEPDKENVKNSENIKDPADILRNFGQEALNKSAKCFITDFDYLISRGKSLYNVLTPGGKRAALASLFPYLEALDSEIERDDCIGAAADALGADREAARADYSRRQNSGRAQREEAGGDEKPIRMSDELFLLSVVAVNPALYPELRRSLEIGEFEDRAAKELYVALEECYANDECGMDALLARIKSPSLQNFLARRGISPEFRDDEKTGRDSARLAADGIKRIRAKRLRARLAELVAELRKGERNPQAPFSQEFDDLLEEKMRIDAELREMEGR